MDQHMISGFGMTVTVMAHGAEMCALQADGQDYLWPAAPPWQRHAPILFPIVGRLKDDTLRHGGQSYRMTQHGFARDRVFTWVDQSAASCHLALTADALTRAMYPFAFRLDVTYALEADGLTITYVITNPADAPLPASIGAHPAFRYPLRADLSKDAHRLVFEKDEPDPIRGVAGGLLTEPRPSPVQGNILALQPDLFVADALILEAPRSRSVRYEAPTGSAIQVSWTGFPQLGIWSRSDADLLCIEPWFGMASPEGFDGDFQDKPGIAIIPPGGELRMSHRIQILP